MTDFANRFAELKQVLDDPEARFIGAHMRDELLSLTDSLPDKAAEAWLFRELAVLEGKRDMPECLDYADRALAAHAQSRALPADRLYFMHLICGDTGLNTSDGPRVKMHLDRALQLHAELARPIEEAFAIRLNEGIFGWTTGNAPLGMDWFLPLLADGERHYGHDSPELSHLLWLMSRSTEGLGSMAEALSYGKRSLDLRSDLPDPGRRVSAMITYANLLHRAGRQQDARRIMGEATAFARANCSAATQEFARERELELFPASSPLQSVITRVKRIFARKG